IRECTQRVNQIGMLVGIRLTLLLLELRQSVVETGICILPIPHSLLDFLMVGHRRIPLLRVIRRLSDIIMEAANANDAPAWIGWAAGISVIIFTSSVFPHDVSRFSDACF